MNIEEAIKAMKGGAKLTHKYLPAMGTQYLYIIDGEYVDSKGYILNKIDVESRLKADIFKFGWQKVESKSRYTRRTLKSYTCFLFRF